jgi:1-acyl-sn-glycerol-3-phosphate acyltransferase
MFSQYLYFPLNLYCLGSHNAPCIPVDIVSRYIIAKAFGHGSDKTVPSDGCNATTMSQPSSSPELLTRGLTPALSLARTETPDKSLDFDESEKETFESWSVPSDSMSETWSMASESTAPPDTRQDRSLPIGHAIHTAAWDQYSSPNAMFSWIEYGQSVVHMGSVLGSVSHPTSYITWFVFKRVLPHLRLTREQFELLHATLVMAPFRATMWVMDVLGIDTSAMKKLGSFLDLPVLFFLFMNQSFTFTSELVAPASLDGDRYMVSCATAAHIFVCESRSNRKEEHPKPGGPFERGLCMAALSIAGRNHRSSISDFWWALTQPRGSVIVRFVAWILVKVLRVACDDVTVDLISFSMSLSRLKSMGESRRILLAPTHRSFFDFLLLSFLFFAVPELQIQLPFIATADDFKRLPVIGRVIQFLGAFFVQRGRGCADPCLSESFRQIFNSCSSHGTTPVLEVFIEGQRSRDRRFVAPRTGLLRWLCEDEFDYLILPITINYERIPEQETLSAESAGGMATGMNLAGMLSWLKVRSCNLATG